MTDQISDLERLERLRADGLITESEFEREKGAILGASTTAPVTFKPRIKFIVSVLVAVVVLFVIGTMILMTMPPPQRAIDQDRNMNAVTAANSSSAAPDTGSDGNMIDPAYLGGAPGEVDPTTQDYYKEALASADKDYPNLSPQIRAVLGKELAADEVCRGGAGAATEKWCAIRDRLVTKLEAMGLCYGSPDDQSAADSEWHSCSAKGAAKPVGASEDGEATAPG